MPWQTLFCICILILNGFGSVLLPSPVPVRSDNLALLTGTLKTLQKFSCDGEYMALRCPTGTTISVQLAQYGRNAPDPSLCSTNTNSHPELLDIMDGYGNVTCHWPSAIQYALLNQVVLNCQKKAVCRFQTTPQPFGADACPGKRKNVEISYKCRPSEFKSVIGCDSEVIQLKCNRSSRLAIYSANYGRTEYENNRCPQNKGVPEESCLASFATETVMNMCHGRRRCNLGVNKATFGTPCKPESTMYLKVVYTCVPRKVLLEKYQGELEPDEMFEDETEYETGDPVGGVLEQPSIYSPDHSKGWVKSTAKPSFPSKSRSSLKYRGRIIPRRQNQYQHQGGDRHSLASPSSIAHSSNTLTRHINLEEKVEQGQSQSAFDLAKPLTPSQKLYPKARYNFPEMYEETNGNKKSVSFPIPTMSTSTSTQNLRNSGGTNHSQDDLRLIYLISQGIRAYDFISRNAETLWLYVTIAIASALLVVVIVILVKIYVQRHTGVRRRGANANLTAASSSAGPITSTILSDIDELSVVTDEVTELPSILRNHNRGSPGDELDLQASSTTHLISSSGASKNVSIAGVIGGGSSAQNSENNVGVTGSPSMLTGVLGGGFSGGGVVVTDGSSSVMPGGEGALLLGGESSVNMVNPSNSTFISSGSATMGRKHYHQHQHHLHHQQQSNHPSSTFMTTYGMGAPTNNTSVTGGSHYNQLQQQQTQGTNPHPLQNPSTMTLGRGGSGRQRDSANMHFYYE